MKQQDLLKVYSKQDILTFTRKRSGEHKLGEQVQTVQEDWRKEVKTSKSTFVILGIPEDIGVRANYGRAGANSAYKPALESFLNVQDNHFIEANQILVLGEVMVDDLMEKAEGLNIKELSDILKLRKLVELIDERVTEVMRILISCKKIPIVIGGGHNNALGNIKGAFFALQKKINVVNCDPHLDFRQKEGRHSGNGFSTAFDEEYLGKYAVLAIHEQYNNKSSLEKFLKFPQRLFFNTYESVFVKEEFDFSNAMKQCFSFVKDEVCGIEIDLDAITNVPSSAKTSSGISPVEARLYAFRAANALQPVYFHIAEGAPILSHIKADNKTGKLIAYLIVDFIKGYNSKMEMKI